VVSGGGSGVGCDYDCGAVGGGGGSAQRDRLQHSGLAVVMAYQQNVLSLEYHGQHFDVVTSNWCVGLTD